MSTTFDIGGHSITLAVFVVAAAVLQWLIFASTSVLSLARVPKQGLRRLDRNLLASSVVFVLLWGSVFVSFGGSEASASARSSAIEKAQGSCSSVDIGSSSATVRSRIGEPDEKRDDAETRGPSATMWIYRGSRCVVHIFDDKVEFVD